MGHAAEETRKHCCEIFRYQPTPDIDKIFEKKLNSSSQNTCNQNTREFIEKCKFCDSAHPRAKSPAKICYVCNRKNYFKVFCPRVGKKVHDI